MIGNEKEYRSTRVSLAGFEEAIANYDILEAIADGIDPIIAKAQLASYERYANELREQINAYELLRQGGPKSLDFNRVEDCGRFLVKARIAQGLTQRELAQIAGIKEQQIQRYEKDFYFSASLRRIAQIATAIGAEFEASFKVAGKPAEQGDGLPFGFSLADFPVSEMRSKGWFGDEYMGSRLNADDKGRMLKDFFAEAPRGMQIALHRKTSGASSTFRNAALLAWQARVLTKARQKAGLARRFSPPSSEVIRKLVSLSVEADGISKAINLLLEFGIIVVFEAHLSKTKLDGAAMSLESGKFAVIGMTARHDRIDNFWFVLLHEIGHIILHWRQVIENGIIDEEMGEESGDLIEKQADEFASTAIIPAEKWKISSVRFTKKSASIFDFASREGLHPALVAGRIRKEREDYSIFSDVIGRGGVRSALKSGGFME